jgi:DNA phosphorothioation-dependent restriction protein DptG
MASAAAATVAKMIESLPESVQNRVVERLRDFIEDARDEMQWDDSFARSQDKLAAVARKAREEASRGLAVPLNPEDL